MNDLVTQLKVHFTVVMSTYNFSACIFTQKVKVTPKALAVAAVL